MDDERAARGRERMKAAMNEEFLPLHDPTRMPTEHQRIALALEYIANHMGRISAALDRIEAKLPAK